MNFKQFVERFINSNNLKKEDIYLNDIYLIMQEFFNIPKEKVNILYKEKILNEKEENILENILQRYYIKKEPLQYIIGKWPFYNEEYIVTKDVLVPRPDTEILVENAIRYITKYNLKSCMDMCCR